jgi:hypothetical protein
MKLISVTFKSLVCISKTLHCKDQFVSDVQGNNCFVLRIIQTSQNTLWTNADLVNAEVYEISGFPWRRVWSWLSSGITWCALCRNWPRFQTDDGRSKHLLNVGPFVRPNNPKDSQPQCWSRRHITWQPCLKCKEVSCEFSFNDTLNTKRVNLHVTIEKNTDNSAWVSHFYFEEVGRHFAVSCVCCTWSPPLWSPQSPLAARRPCTALWVSIPGSVIVSGERHCSSCPVCIPYLAKSHNAMGWHIKLVYKIRY